MRFAIINTTTNLVENVVEYIAQPSTPPPGYASNYIAVPDEVSSPGWAWNGTAVVAPPAPPVVPYVPQVVDAMQAKVALSRSGLLTAVQNWVNTQSAETQLIWNSATTFQRTSTLINSAATALTWDSAALDKLFQLAATINP